MKKVKFSVLVMAMFITFITCYCTGSPPITDKQKQTTEMLETNLNYNFPVVIQADVNCPVVIMPVVQICETSLIVSRSIESYNYILFSAMNVSDKGSCNNTVSVSSSPALYIIKITATGCSDKQINYLCDVEGQNRSGCITKTTYSYNNKSTDTANDIKFSRLTSPAENS